MYIIQIAFLILEILTKQNIAKSINCEISRYEEVETILENCKNISIGNLQVPKGKTLDLQPQDNTTIYVNGNVTFEYYPWLGPLIQINATGLKLIGKEGSFLHGNGQLYWDGLGEWGSPKPHFVFITAFQSVFKNLQLVNSPRYFILLSDSEDVVFENILLNNIQGGSAEFLTNYTGHNTDGFDVWNSTDVQIKNSQVFNQDDCIALRCGRNIHVSNLFCHGGNGFSLSVGFDNSSILLNTLKNITIEDSTFVDGDNAIHIKTHVDGGNGSISDVTYRNIKFDVSWGSTGINIQQNYRNLPPGHPANATAKYPKGNIPITNLKLIDIVGSISSGTKRQIPVNIYCAQGACANWKWKNIKVLATNPNDKCNFEPEGYRCENSTSI